VIANLLYMRSLEIVKLAAALFVVRFGTKALLDLPHKKKNK
jgi:hypothetical protein